MQEQEPREKFEESDFTAIGDNFKVVGLDQEFLRSWNLFVGISPTSFYESLSHELDGLVATFWLYPTGSGGLKLDVKGFFSELFIDFEAKEARLNEIRARPEFRGSGTFKSIMRNVIYTLRDLDFNRVELFATEVGAYAFAKMGFLPSLEEWLQLREQFRERLKYIKLDEEQRNYVLGLLESDDPKTMWKIADLDTPVEITRDEPFSDE